MRGQSGNSRDNEEALLSLYCKEGEGSLSIPGGSSSSGGSSTSGDLTDNEEEDGQGEEGKQEEREEDKEEEEEEEEEVEEVSEDASKNAKAAERKDECDDFSYLFRMEIHHLSNMSPAEKRQADFSLWDAWRQKRRMRRAQRKYEKMSREKETEKAMIGTRKEEGRNEKEEEGKVVNDDHDQIGEASRLPRTASQRRLESRRNRRRKRRERWQKFIGKLKMPAPNGGAMGRLRSRRSKKKKKKHMTKK